MRYHLQLQTSIILAITEAHGFQLEQININIASSPHSVYAWNNVNIFNKHYMDFFCVNADPIFSIHNPLGKTLLTRLRVGLSHLHEHRYQQDFVDTRYPFCTCECKSIESVEHYLLRSPNHAPTVSYFSRIRNLKT